ncbi:MAG: amino acid ABC transporter permease [Micropruina sp.]|uniref:amino acid ABC transporter permease n=1 Tax=Micropruina sp. TaxID=2737536 RepID=UPI0039E5FF75
MSMQHALFDTAGPKARARVRIFTVISVLILLAIIGLAYWQLYLSGALAPSKWLPFTQPAIQSYFAGALGRTALAALGAAVIAVPLGLVLALGRLSPVALFRWPATAFIEFFRAIPVLLVIYAFMFALPSYGINPSEYWKLVIPVGLCTAAVIAEVFRAGVLALPRGQTEAGLSVGLTPGQTFRLVVFPQALRVVIPALVAQAVIVVKDTAFGYVVSYPELQQSARVLVANTRNLVQTYLVVTVIYIVINLLISRVAVWMDRKLATRRAGKTKFVSLTTGRGPIQ